MASERISQILPTVKCSDCGRDVLIRRLGDHLCSSQPPVPSLPIIPAMKDKYKPTQQQKPISPLQSPNNKYPYNINTSQSATTNNTKTGAVTPPYHQQYGSAQQSQQQPRGYTDDHFYNDDHFYSGSNNSLDYLPNERRRKNSSNSPVPSSPVSSPYRKNNDSNTDFNTRYEGTRKQSLGNIYNQAKASKSTPTTATNNNSSGALDNLMADLMNSMNDDIHLMPTSNPLLSKNNNYNNKSTHCAVCHEEFDYRDDVKQVGQDCYHKACFICRLCSSPFDQRRTHHEYEGKLYCERDFHVVKNRIMCAACDRAIPPSVAPIKALGKFYHPGHIKCYHCLNSITESTGWKEHQGRVYCRQDFKALFLPKCRACHNTIEKNAVSAMDGKLKGKWHLECFGCHTCFKPFPDNIFYIYDDLPYCKRHYHELNGSLCVQCHEGIEGQCAYLPEQSWRFHPNCFGCSVCRTPLNDIFFMYDRRIYCETHIRDLQQRKNIRAEKRRTQFGRI